LGEREKEKDREERGVGGEKGRAGKERGRG